jgi:hypothetical protein
MARKPAPVEVAPPTGEIELPDKASFAPPKIDEDVDAKGVGKVQGLDYEEWASAVIDLNMAPDRIARERVRLSRKGYQKLGGSPIVRGFPNVEAWVIPREQWLANRERRAERIAAAVDAGTMSESALHTAQIVRSRASAGK